MFIMGKAATWLAVTHSNYAHGRQLLLMRALLAEDPDTASHPH